MDEKRTDFRKLSEAKRGLMFRVLAIGVVLYWLYGIVRDYLAGGPEAPSLTLLIIAIAVMGGGSVLLAVISWKLWKLAKENAVMTDDEIAEMEALRGDDAAEDPQEPEA